MTPQFGRIRRSGAMASAALEGTRGPHMTLKINVKPVFVAAALAAAASLQGCGFDDVQLNGKIFDAMGMNTGSVKAKEPKVAVRQPLVVPPGLESLPQPGSGKADLPAMAEIQDHDAKNNKSREQLEQEQAEYCRKNYDQAKAMGDESADSVSGSSIFSAIQKWNKGDDDTESQ